MAAIDGSVKERSRFAVGILGSLGRVRAAFLFGSQASGNATPWSDIDIAAFVEGVERWDIRQRARAMVLVQRAAGTDIEMHLLPASSLSTAAAGSFAAYVLRHGVPIELEEIATPGE